MIKTVKLSLSIILVAVGCILAYLSTGFIQAGSGSFVEPNMFFLGLIFLIIGSIIILYDFKKSKNILFIAYPLCLLFVLVISNAIYVAYYLDDGYHPEFPHILFQQDVESSEGWLNFTVTDTQYSEPIEWEDIEIIPYLEPWDRIEDFSWTFISDYESVQLDDKLCIQIDNCDFIEFGWKPAGTVICSITVS